ncbi:MAG: D-alanine--D-alanine ligase [Patescibacteria group bacterium]
MNQKKIKIGIIFGGRSAEHEVSLQSAKNVYEALDKNKYHPVLIIINKAGKWLPCDEAIFLPPSSTSEKKELEEIVFPSQGNGNIVNLTNPENKYSLDVAFPILHGPFGEDGTIQGLLKLANIPFVGAGVLGSAVGMDKDVMKRLLREAGIPIGKFVALKSDDAIPDFTEIVAKLGTPFFIKPANMGSSVGVNKVNSQTEYIAAVKTAFSYDVKIIIEEFIAGREIECGVLGNSHPLASVPGEIVPTHEFYSYDAKYLDENGAKLEIPAKLSAKTTKQIQDLAIQTFQTLSCSGLGRVDFFLKDNGDILVNEINTIPGFTKISMYPKLWAASGISYPELIDNLIQLAIERFQQEQKLL